ncbi:MAG TPA: hypothetical protein VHM89_13845 [Acidimicrobiales bacterium]|nr:hypothetical protein [Acidimicrobiales bacterium]
MRRLAVVVVSAIVVAGAGCSKEPVRSGQAVVEISKGSRVLIGERNQGLRPATGNRTLHVGAQVKVLDGSASISLEDGARLDVRKGSEIGLGSPLSLVADDLLVTSGRAPVKVAVAGSAVTVDGVARLTRDLAVSAATYRGSVTVQSAARTLVVPALRQTQVPSLGVLPATAEPLDYDTKDIWDRRFLGVAMELTDQLEARSRGFTNLLEPGSGRTAGFFRLLLPALENEPAFDQDLLSDTRPPGETLIGAAIAVSGKIGSFVERWDSVFRFKGQGASWGLVALDQQVNNADSLVHTVDVAIGGQSFAFAPAPTVAPVVEPPPPAPVEAPTPQSTPRSSAPAPAPAAPATPTKPAAEPPPLITLPELPELVPPANPDDPGLLTPLLDVVTDTLSGLLAPG